MNNIEEAVQSAFATLTTTEPSQVTEEVKSESELGTDEAVSTPTDAGASEPDEASEGTEAEEEGGSLDEAEDDGDGDNDDTEAVVLTEDTLVSIDGKTDTVANLLARQADYTKKTQALAEERKSFSSEQDEMRDKAKQVLDLHQEMTDWYSQRQANPVAWGAEIAGQTGDATGFVAQLITELNGAGVLDPKFVEAFGLAAPDNAVAQAAAFGKAQDRIARLEAEQDAQRQAYEEQQMEAQVAQSIESELNQVVADNDLKFASAQEREKFRRELFTVATEYEIADLAKAYKVMKAEISSADNSVKSKPVVNPERRVEAVQRKRAARAMSRPTDGGQESAPPTQYESIEDAIRATWTELEARGR